MKFKLILLILFVSFASYGQRASDTLTNQKIILMVKNGLSDLVIKKSIQNSGAFNFDLSSDGLIQLKQNKVSDSLILSLFDKAGGVKNSKSNEQQITPADKKEIASSRSDFITIVAKPGIYYFDSVKNEFELLHGVKSSMKVSQRYIGVGFKSVWQYEFSGDKAQKQIKSNAPVFYLIEGNGQYGTVFEPTRFVLINTESKKGMRRIEVSSGIKTPSAFSEKAGMVTPIFTKLQPGIYKITFEKKLPVGNYYFAPAQIAYDLSLEFFEFDIK